MVAQINRLIVRYGKLYAKLLVIFGWATVFAFSANASDSLSLISDDETESFLAQIVRPLYNAAGVAFVPHKIFIVNDPTLNAFVSNGNYLFVHTGTLIQADSANQISGIIAHETGHISGGHIARQKLKLEILSKLSVASLLAAGAAAAVSGRGDAAMAVVLGSHSSLLNSMTAYQLQEERNADESAVRYLAKTDQSPQGLGLFMKKIKNVNMLSGYEETPYFRTHPLSSERLRFFEEQEKISKGSAKSPLEQQFQFIKAKLSAFLLPPERVALLYPADQMSPQAMYAHAITAYKSSDIKRAISLLDQLIAHYPENPYFYELKGQFLFESGRLSEALPSYEKARQLNPRAYGTTIGWAQTILEVPHTKSDTTRVINALNMLLIEQSTPMGWLLLARAYDDNAQHAEALYASARYSTEIGNIEAARRQIREAEKLSPSKPLTLKLNDLKQSPELTEKKE